MERRDRGGGWYFAALVWQKEPETLLLILGVSLPHSIVDVRSESVYLYFYILEYICVFE